MLCFHMCVLLQHIYISSYPGDLGGYRTFAANILGHYPTVGQNRPLADAIVSLILYCANLVPHRLK